MRIWTMLGLLTLTLGCTDRGAEVTGAKTPAENRSHHAEQAVAPKDEHASHGGHVEVEAPRELVIGTDPAEPQADALTKLVLQIQGADGTTVKKFEVLHEKLVHLILIREGLDVFDHLHPEVDASGMIVAKHRFSKAGIYHLFADYQPQGKSPALAVGTVIVAGEAEAAAPLVPNSSSVVTVGALKAGITLREDGAATNITYRITDASDKPVADLEPYLGAMGHLVVVSADGKDYVHSHPVSEEQTAPDGTVGFVAHFGKPGLYKAWGQFQREGSVFTVPFVIEHKGSPSQSDGGEH